jgi:hypothetical protein
MELRPPHAVARRSLCHQLQLPPRLLVFQVVQWEMNQLQQGERRAKREQSDERRLLLGRCSATACAVRSF